MSKKLNLSKSVFYGEFVRILTTIEQTFETRDEHDSPILNTMPISYEAYFIDSDNQFVYMGEMIDGDAQIFAAVSLKQIVSIQIVENNPPQLNDDSQTIKKEDLN